MHKVIAIIIVIIILLVFYAAGAEDYTQFILCDPKVENYVCIRRSPRKGSEETGRLECGDSFITDGRYKNGFIHILGMTEYGEGWVYAGYVVDDRPVIGRCNATVAATGRVMTRRYIGGRKSGWVSVSADLKVYAYSTEWAVTSKGYIPTKYLEIWQ